MKNYQSKWEKNENGTMILVYRYNCDNCNKGKDILIKMNTGENFCFKCVYANS